MVVQCESCETQFRFDESLIESAGIWVRCSRCKNLFFLEKPLTDEMLSLKGKEMIIEDTHVQERGEKSQVQIGNDLNREVSLPSGGFIDKTEEDHIPLDVENSEKVEIVERLGDPHIESFEKDMGELDRDR
jgi:predicted Zn finger-like uncharacterized protein